MILLNKNLQITASSNLHKDFKKHLLDGGYMYIHTRMYVYPLTILHTLTSSLIEPV